MTLRRRALFGATLAAGTVALARPAYVQTRRKIRIAYGVPTLESCDSGFFSSIPQGMGFFADEGLDVEILQLNGAGVAMSMLAAGQAEFTTHGGAGVLAGVGQGVPIRAFIVQVPDNFYSIGVEDSGPIKSIEDLKGKVVGVPALGGSPYVLIKAVFRQLGWDPARDVSYQAVGVGVPALDALQRGRVAAILAWDAPFATYQAKGARLRLFQPKPLPDVGFTDTTNTTPSRLEKDPALVAAMGRAMARSLVFMAAAAPDELIRLHTRVYPSARSPGIPDDEFYKIERSRLEARRANMRFPERVFSRREKLGDETDARIAKGRDLLFEGGEIKTAAPIDQIFTRRFLPQMNAIDVDGLIAKARAFKA